MKIAGVICEYNPFHLGHLYQLRQARTLGDADGVIAIMSGNFTQRGQCAIVDKYYRTQMALAGGADLVLELPAVYATAASGYFAQGAVLSLAACGVVDLLSFGSESGDLPRLKSCAAVLAQEPPDYAQALRQNLLRGEPYPKAQSLALSSACGLKPPELDEPNDLLALNYLTAIARFALPLDALPVIRLGSHHGENETGFASSGQIRRKIAAKEAYLQDLPPFSARLMMQAHLLPMSELEPALLMLLQRASAQELLELPDMTIELVNRLQKAKAEYNSLDEILSAVKNRSCTYTRLSRLLCHLLLHIRRDAPAEPPAYLRLLGFNDNGRQILKRIKKQSSLPLLTNLSAASSLLDENARKMLAVDERAAKIYRSFTGEFTGKAEYQLFPFYAKSTV